MAERRKKRDVRLEFAFDRLVAVKLEQVYEILVPDQVRFARAGADVTGGEDETRRDLRQSVVGQTEGGEHDRQSDERVIAFAREQNCDVPTEWVIEDDGYSGASLLRPGS